MSSSRFGPSTPAAEPVLRMMPLLTPSTAESAENSAPAPLAPVYVTFEIATPGPASACASCSGVTPCVMSWTAIPPDGRGER